MVFLTVVINYSSPRELGIRLNNVHCSLIRWNSCQIFDLWISGDWDWSEQLCLWKQRSNTNLPVSPLLSSWTEHNDWNQPTLGQTTALWFCECCLLNTVVCVLWTLYWGRDQAEITPVTLTSPPAPTNEHHVQQSGSFLLLLCTGKCWSWTLVDICHFFIQAETSDISDGFPTDKAGVPKPGPEPPLSMEDTNSLCLPLLHPHLRWWLPAFDWLNTPDPGSQHRVVQG